MKKRLSPLFLLRSQKGSLMIIALVGLVILSGSFYVSIAHLMQTQKHIRTVVIKQQMIAAETRLHNLLMQPTSYKLVPPSKVAVLREEVLEQFNIFIPGARCKDGEDPCGIKVARLIENNSEVPYWNATSSKFSGRLVYAGQEVPVAPLNLEINVPREVIQIQKYICPTTTPFLAGFHENGDLICRPLPQPSSCGPVGGYILGVNSNLSAICGNFGATIECGSDSYISPPGPSWDGRSWIPSGCTPRIDPYSNPQLRPE